MKIPSHIKAVIFDMDGLLIDSEPYWEKTTEAFFAKHNKPLSPAVYEYTLGRGLRDVVEYFKREWGFEGDTDTLIAERKETLYTFLLKDLAFMKGAEELIRAIRKDRLLLAIATSAHSHERTKEILSKADLDKFFPVLVSGDDVKEAKPAPDIYLKTAELLKINPKDCLVFEDAPNGVKAGKAAGMTVYAVNKDESMYSKLKKAGADAVFQSLKEVTV